MVDFSANYWRTTASRLQQNQQPLPETASSVPTQGGTSGIMAQCAHKPNNTLDAPNPYEHPRANNNPYAANSYEQPPVNNNPGRRGTIDTALVEVGDYTDGQIDEHARSVEEIAKRKNPNGNLQIVGIGEEDPNAVSSTGADDSANQSPPISTLDDLNHFVDSVSTDAMDRMSAKVADLINDGKTDVINGSLGFSRNDLYGSVIQALTSNPQLGLSLGIDPNDIAKVTIDGNGSVKAPQAVSDAVVRYVDSHIDAQGSAFQQSKANYQAVTHQAAQAGIVTVVAAGNAREDSPMYSMHGSIGGDTNFLAESNDVISVAASEKQDGSSGTGNGTGRKVADFSSWGDGQFNPTVSANGVGVDTKYGPQDGTSFAAPQVTATVARMLQANPNLTFQQVKALLQGTATDIIPNSDIADGAGDINSAQAVAQAKALSGTANLSWASYLSRSRQAQLAS